MVHRANHSELILIEHVLANGHIAVAKVRSAMKVVTVDIFRRRRL